MNVLPPVIWVLAGPSGSGKTTLARALAARDPGRLRRVRTCTTRSPRPGERPDQDYRFVSEAEFAALRQAGALLEETQYGGHRYGVPAADIAGPTEVVVVVDPPGIRHLRERYGDRVVAICLAGHSAADLAARLAGRGAATEEIALRLCDLEEEAAALLAACDIRIPPGTPDQVLGAVEAVVAAQRERRS